MSAREAVKSRTDDQRAAADPGASVWVAASAGTGKTQVLTDRVLNLMLGGTDPTHILCLTFTKAAAAEMATRLAERLAHWVTSDDAKLDADLKALTGVGPDAARRQRARQLFALVLDAPGGMRIETIHAFCQSLLRRFPLEAKVAPHFDLLEDRGAAELMRDAREEVFARARAGEARLGANLAAVTAHANEDGFAALMQSLATERGRLARLLREHGGADGLAAAVAAALGVKPGESAEAVVAAACADAMLDLMGLRLAATKLQAGSPKDCERGDVIADWLADPAGRVEKFDAYAKAFLTDEGTIRKKLATKAVLETDPHVGTVLAAEAQRLLAVTQARKAAVVAAATAALLVIGEAILDAYRRRKRARARLDYDDFIQAARGLLLRPEVAPWVLYKLDHRLDHILVDEAQDTNPEQWDVIAALAGEFFSGEGARAERRTVFAVGDAKQSIFSFQRADPKVFLERGEYFAPQVRGLGLRWADVPLTLSFRSVPAVLTAVDAVFAQDEARAGVDLDRRPIRHQSSRQGEAGLVELWPPVAPGDKATLDPWPLPVERVADDEPRARLARLIAQRIAGMIGRDVLEARGRTVRPGDIMVLVRRRNALVEEIVRELKQRQVPVAGVDRLVLTDQIAVMDLVALGRFLLLPEDDLTLATVLKSPIFALDEEQLFRLAWNRGQASLWSILAARAGEEAAFARAHELLRQLLARADFTPPYELYAELLGRHGGRRALLARLGPEAADPIDEFLTLALQFERSHVASLQGFLHWLAQGAVEVKRDLDQGAGEVRVMTVHGAKGLEAPIVFLPDTTALPWSAGGLLWQPPEQGGLPLWSPGTEWNEAVVNAAREATRTARMEEYRRLLYVAMTRAEDRLYVCGWQGGRTGGAGNWYDLIASGLVASGLKGQGESFAFDAGAEIGADGWVGEGLRIVGVQRRKAKKEEEEAPAPILPLPSWARESAPAEEPTARPLAPSRPPSEEPAVLSPLAIEQAPHFRRGRLVHRLLELLPDLAPALRADACRLFLAQPAHGLAADEAEAMAVEVLRLLDDQRFAALFGPDSLAEAPLAGEIESHDGRRLAVAGRVDRLAVMADRVMVVDYKTGRLAPAEDAATPEAYLWQMATYRALLARIYPDRPVTCCLLWTAGPALQVLSDSRLAALKL